MSHPESAGLLNSMIHEMDPIACHMGLPCGTCSRAREQAIPAAKKARGAPEPVPLRDAQALLGLKNLSKKDQQKVDAANQVYTTAVQVMLQCYLCGVILVIENPVRSWLWPLLALLVKQTRHQGFIDWYFSLHEIVYAACMHGGKRDEYTKLLSSTPCLQPLACECDGGHETLALGSTTILRPRGPLQQLPKLSTQHFCVPDTLICLLHWLTNKGWNLQPPAVSP